MMKSSTEENLHTDVVLRQIACEAVNLQLASCDFRVKVNDSTGYRVERITNDEWIVQKMFETLDSAIYWMSGYRSVDRAVEENLTLTFDRKRACR